MCRLFVSLLLLCVPLSRAPSRLSAQGPSDPAAPDVVERLETARRLVLEEPDYPAAIAVLTGVEAEPRLQVAQAVEAYELRALARFALADREGAVLDLRRAIFLDPDRPLSSLVNPILREAALTAPPAAAPTLEVQAERTQSNVAVVARTETDPLGLARSVRVFIRVNDQWEMAVGRASAVTDGEVAYYVRAIGPGGIVLASVGSERNPQRLPAASATSRPADDTWWHTLIAVGVPLLVAAAVASILWASGVFEVSNGVMPTFPSPALVLRY